ncbi:proline-rich receptor-like protein kinase PERK4 [Chenopodium quinoa]|nr:proline-rich receptor-like protein kinase PERK4 [Chenopodium quinoa]
MAEDGSSSPSPDQSPPSSGASSSPPPSGSSSSPSPPPPSQSSSSPPPSSPPPSSPAPPESGNSSPSPPPPSEGSSSSPPPPSSGSSSSSSPPPPSEGGGGGGSGSDNGNNNNQPPREGGGNDSGGGPSRDVPSQPRSPPQELTPSGPRGGSSNQSPSPSSLTGGGSSGGGSSKSNGSGVITGVVVVGGLLLFLMAVCVFCIRKKKRRKSESMPSYGWEGGPNKPQGNYYNNNQYWQNSSQDHHAVKIPPTSGGQGWGNPTSGDESGQQSGHNATSTAPSPGLSLGFNKSQFTYAELAAATNGFDRSMMLGQGGFGYVHKGVLPNGKEIAVKSLKSGSGQGEREFQAEVEIISRVHHRHLVSLVGYCIAGGQRMLVYEFVPNETLEYHLHKRGELDFPTRLRVALGSAKGLGYLHEDCHPRIIHRDIKASNILLDENYEAMVADFGLAKLTTDTNTHVSTRVMGTFGYLAPEYASSGKLTEKSDVFSYGVMLLEIITGRRPVDPQMKYMEDSLVDWSRPLLTKALETGNYHEFVDPRLEENYDPNLMKRMVACAAASIRHSAKRRPKMSQIVRALEGDVSLEDLNSEGQKPVQNTMLSSSGSSDYDTRAYSKDLKKFRQMALATQDFASSEYGGTTSEYGLNPSSSSSDISKEINSKNIP